MKQKLHALQLHFLLIATTALVTGWSTASRASQCSIVFANQFETLLSLNHQPFTQRLLLYRARLESLAYLNGIKTLNPNSFYEFSLGLETSFADHNIKNLLDQQAVAIEGLKKYFGERNVTNVEIYQRVMVSVRLRTTLLIFDQLLNDLLQGHVHLPQLSGTLDFGSLKSSVPDGIEDAGMAISEPGDLRLISRSAKSMRSDGTMWFGVRLQLPEMTFVFPPTVLADLDKPIAHWKEAVKTGQSHFKESLTIQATRLNKPSFISKFWGSSQPTLEFGEPLGAVIYFRSTLAQFKKLYPWLNSQENVKGVYVY